MSEAESGTEKVETQTGSEAEQPNSAAESKAIVAQTSTETVTKIKKVATPRQLEALRLARVKRMEKAAARKLEYAKLAEKVSVGQGSDSDSSVEYVIKKIKRNKKVTKDEVTMTQPVVTPTRHHYETPRQESSDDDSEHTPQKKKKTTPPRQEVFALNFV